MPACRAVGGTLRLQETLLTRRPGRARLLHGPDGCYHDGGSTLYLNKPLLWRTPRPSPHTRQSQKTRAYVSGLIKRRDTALGAQSLVNVDQHTEYSFIEYDGVSTFTMSVTVSTFPTSTRDSLRKDRLLIPGDSFIQPTVTSRSRYSVKQSPKLQRCVNN